MQNRKLTVLLGLGVLLSGNVVAQRHADEIIRLTTTKVERIIQGDRILEKSFSDIISHSDTVLSNCRYKHRFSPSNTYHLNGFASSEDVTDIDVVIFKFDANNKAQVVARDNIASNDVSFTFKPTVGGEYNIAVIATLRKDIKNPFFTLLVDREKFQ